MRVVIGTGGTAGHIFPALATGVQLRDRFRADVRFLGTAGGQEATLVPEAGFRFEAIEALPFVRAFSLRTVRAPFAALRAAARARAILEGSDVAVGMGGYVSVPVTLAARKATVPLVVHEQNAVMGLANRLAGRWARTIALSYPEAARHAPRRSRTRVVGNPVRAEIVEAAGSRDRLIPRAREALRLEEGRTTILVFGGSQGAVRLNAAAVELAAKLSDRADLQLLLLTGPRHHADVVARLPSSSALIVRALPFLESIEHAYAVADLAVARAGATTVAELAVSGVPAILVPYPYATANHQEANARAMERAGAARVLLDEQTSGASVARAIAELTRWPDRLTSMSASATAFGRPDAADALAELIASIASVGEDRGS